jgi:4-amino-4-deoxy-L-arabinose transferase-like glycosyltransferase
MSARTFALLFLAAALVRIVALPSGGTPDVEAFRIWTYRAATDGPTQVYGTGSPREQRYLEYDGRSTVIDYPPVAAYVLAATGHVYRALFPTFPNTPLLTSALKVPGLLAAAGLTMLILWIVGARWGTSAGRVAAMAYWANPAVILHGAFLGYLDSLVALPAVAALAAATHGRAATSGALLALACLVKPQGIFVAPAVALALVPGSREGWRGATAALTAGAIVATAVVWPFVRAGTFQNMVHGVGGLLNDGMLSGNAANVWWLVGYAIRVVERSVITGVFSLAVDARILGLHELLLPGQTLAGFQLGSLLVFCATWCVVGAAVACAMWRARRVSGLPVAVALATLTVHIYFVLAVQVHENHMYLVIPLLAMLVPVHAEYRRLFALLSVIVLLNLNLFYGFGRGIGFALRNSITVVDLTVVLAAVNIVALVWHCWLFSRLCRTEAFPIQPDVRSWSMQRKDAGRGGLRLLPRRVARLYNDGLAG